MFRPACGFLLLVTTLAAAAPAPAAWLHCRASATDPAGAVAYYTTVANVGPVAPARLLHFRQALTAYVAKANAEARGTQADCFAFEDQLTATSHYSKMLNAAALRLGWDHVIVVNPQSWLADSDVVDDPSRP